MNRFPIGIAEAIPGPVFLFELRQSYHILLLNLAPPSAERASPEDSRFGQIIGNSSALEFVLAEVERVAPTDSTVLVLGETGTGKELIARAIHNLSARIGRPFIKLN